ncbi:MAG: GerMN domain-containing protein [Clostridia bacterium]|nr:GerMN domain-containing protein [Clostridia bacterium]
MKNKKIGLIFLVLLIIILIGGYFGIRYVKNKEKETTVEEYIPEEEITEEQARQTIVSLYFPNRETNEINPEARLIDIKEIINNAHEKLIELLIEGPKNDKNKKIIPEGTRINKTYLEEDCVVLDFSSEFLNYNKEDEKEKTNLINCMVNTLTELTEINKVKILIDGNESEEFKEVYSREQGE